MVLDIEREEAEAFLRSHGVFPLEKVRADLACSLDETKRKRLHEVRSELGPLEEVIMQMPLIKRLQRLKQLGGKVNPQKVSPSPLPLLPAFHTRYEHSRLIVELGKAAGVQLGLPTKDIAYLMMGGWFHDVGHSAFSHCGDEFLIRNGLPDHEQRGENYIRDNPEIRKPLEQHDINVERIIGVIK